MTRLACGYLHVGTLQIHCNWRPVVPIRGGCHASSRAIKAFVVFEVSELYEPLAEDRCISLSLESESVPAIHGDRALLFEAFSNLLDNAIKFAPDHGEVRIGLAVLKQGAQLMVSDNGPGIPKGEREAVLQRFYRGNQVGHLAGSGLGLSVVSAVIRLHDFTLRIGGNEPGPGTSMTVECWSHALD